MKSDLDIAHDAKLVPIIDIAHKLSIPDEYVIPCGRHKAKISLKMLEQLAGKTPGKLILVTAMTPTPYGEGKTTVSIGLSMALNRIGKSSIVALREPSLGPVFGIKGGAAGGGYVQVVPMEDINLHFTGDLHAIGAAHNLLAAVLDNHIHFGNALNVDEREILFTRAMDMNDRSLRRIVVGLGGKPNGPAREDGFIITAASEVMAILALSRTPEELKQKLGNILVAFDMERKPVFARDFKIHGAMTALLKDALKPNLVQTLDHTPAFIHCGPFANIAHGTCSINAIEMAQRMCDYTVVEAGFGSDLGAEKFINIVAPMAGLNVDAAVMVATMRALKMHGGAPKRTSQSGTIDHLKKGLDNLKKHLENMNKLAVPPVVAINIFSDDMPEEIDLVKNFCKNEGVECAEVRAFEQGSPGAIALAELVCEEVLKGRCCMKPLYQAETPIEEKITRVAVDIYGADRVVFTPGAEKDMRRIIKLNLHTLPVCIAKTNMSLSDNPQLFGRPRNFKITIRGVNISSGAGFLVPLTGEIMLMPGLSRVPNAERIDVDTTGMISGLS